MNWKDVRAAKKRGAEASRQRRLDDIRDAMRDPTRREAMLADLGRLATKVRKEYDEHVAALQNERAALREFLSAFLTSSFPKKRHRLTFLEEFCEELAQEIADEIEDREAPPPPRHAGGERPDEETER